MNSLIDPGDWWILLLTLAAIGLYAVKPLRLVSIVVLIGSTVMVGQRYGAYRGILHTVICILTIVALLYLKSKLDTRRRQA